MTQKYQIRDEQGSVVAEFEHLLSARIASVDMSEGTQIVELSFVNGQWEESVLYERASLSPPEGRQG